MLRESDEALLERIVLGDGDEPAFGELYRRYNRDIYRFAYGMCGAAWIAEDCTQDVFLGMLERGAGYRRFNGSLRAWLYGIARHKVIDRLRQRGRLEFGFDPSHVGDDSQGPDQYVVSHRRVDDLRRAIVALPIRYREVIVLCELEELSYADAAGMLDCPVGTVRSRLHRARGMLAKKLRSGAHVVTRTMLVDGKLGEG